MCESNRKYIHKAQPQEIVSSLIQNQVFTIFQETESEQRIQKQRDPAIQGLIITETSETRSSKVVVIQYKANDGKTRIRENRNRCICINNKDTKF